MFIAFDVGDTLIQYEGVALDWTAHYRPALYNALFQASAVTDEESLSAAIEILTFYNTRKNPRTFEIQVGEVTSKIAKLFDVSHSDFERGFFSYFQRRSSPMPGAAQLLGHLRRAGAHLAALSDVPYGMPTAMLIEDLGGLASAFDSIVSSCDVGMRKPHSKGLCQLLWSSSCAKDRSWYVGNEEKDMAAARSANMYGILLSPLHSAPDYGQTHTIQSLADVATIVL